MQNPWTMIEGSGPLVAAAIHDGHEMRPEVLTATALDDDERLREEDPYTGQLAEILPSRIIVHRSRFSVDLNRAREKGVYRTPEDAWGLDVWSEPGLPDDVAARSLALYDAFNRDLFAFLDRVHKEHGRFVLYDLHTYNHRRGGPEGESADPVENPEVNLGTKHIDVDEWHPVIDTFMTTLSAQRLGNHLLDVRENVKFGGGNFAARVHERYGRDACVLAIEFKKVFMDEWTGTPDPTALAELKEALAATVDPVRGVIGQI